MFPARYFDPRFWASRYWPKQGLTVVSVADVTFLVAAEDRQLIAGRDSRSWRAVDEGRAFAAGFEVNRFLVPSETRTVTP